MGKYLCVDLGATSGRVMEVEFKDAKISLKELGRFPTEGTKLPFDNGFKLVWDIPSFWKDIQNILSRVKEASSIAVDGWGVDFALLDRKGRLMKLPSHYRDIEHMDKAEEVINELGREKIFLETGIQIMPINTLYQVYALWKNSPYILENSSALLMIPDLFTYFLSGQKICEYTNATTTQMYRVAKDEWAKELLQSLSLPAHFLLPVTRPGEAIGKVRKSLNILKNTRVVATGSHDTASAIVGTPMTEDSIYISSGTWSLVGIEIDQPLINAETLQNNFTNEGGVGKVTFLKNITGMWIFEECRREWNKSLQELLQVRDIKSSAVIDVDEARFQTPGNMPGKIVSYLKETGQKVPESILETVRILFESLALKYRWVIEKIEKLTGKKYSRIHIVGGGAKNEFLNQLVADVTGKTVYAGPYEATTIGSSIVQMLSLGEISSIEEGREIIRNSFELKLYQPGENIFAEKYDLFKKLLKE
ncbi:MAG: rhamnulokinase [Caldiserica bacterium]|nr:rhamnulokinase [Caldisericota bacterium]